MRKFKVIEHNDRLFFFNWDQQLPDFDGPHVRMMPYYAEVTVDTKTGEVLKNRYGHSGEILKRFDNRYCMWCHKGC